MSFTGSVYCDKDLIDAPSVERYGEAFVSVSFDGKVVEGFTSKKEAARLMSDLSGGLNE